ncbi:glyoxalase [Bacillus mangrovi]|uniref:Glyoxalase n=1 Tax=Metabacillus mangrovi TaxID=1491830 RepID=A0A7X2S4H1_9BACI|nr:VOC family protein [Metabacillus mangrovi]MTH53095.1 glyoxalase [Metabacillus mangrovi]
MNKIQYSKIDHVQICVPAHSESEAREFYLHTLGFKEISKPESLRGSGGFWCSAGEIEVHIGLEDIKETESRRHPAFEITNLDEARKLLVEAGVKIKEEKPIPGRERYSFPDPFGNKIEFLEYKKS